MMIAWSAGSSNRGVRHAKGRIPFLQRHESRFDWQVSKNVMLTAGLYNLTNQKYWLYQNVRNIGPGGITGTSPSSLDRFTQPGISTRIALTLQF